MSSYFQATVLKRSLTGADQPLKEDNSSVEEVVVRVDSAKYIKRMLIK